MNPPALPPDVPLPLDQELLAWAAGFFDGEGTAFARTDGDRPGYRQLDVSVPQCGHDRVPEALLKYQRSMLGVGRIYGPNKNDVYVWRAGGRLGAEAALGLMWPHLGQVKRTQAIEALEVVREQYRSGRYTARRAKYRPRFIAHGPAEQLSTIADKELAWAAGFVDAEGCFGVTRLPTRKDGSARLRIRVSASQHGSPGAPAEVLLRLQNAFGLGRVERHGDPDDFKWVAEGVRAVETVLEAIRPWLGPVKIEQARLALDAAGTLGRVRGDELHCIRGHVYDDVYIRMNGHIHRRCNACARIVERAKRAAQGIKPRQFKNVERRYAA